MNITHTTSTRCAPWLRAGAAVRHTMVALALLGASAWAGAGEAAHVFHAEGDVKVANRPVAIGAVVQEGEEITTGGNGYIYMKTLDDGLFILRPNSVARIVTYHVDAKNPANTRIKLELLKGIARSQSGTAVKAARQNFRFNTPVAAIGVRGTDFTVFTDAETSRVSVLSGAIVISGFGGNCNPSGVGPCEGSTSRELRATQVGQLLQVKRGQAAPQLLNGAPLAPDVAPPPHVEEPAVKNTTSAAPLTVSPGTTLAGNDLNLDAQKNANLLQKIPAAGSGSSPVVTPPPVVVVDPPLPARQVIWGRYEALAGQAATIDNSQQLAEKSQLVAMFGSFSLFRTAGATWTIPDHGSTGFALKQSEAYIRDDTTNLSTLAQITNGKLNINFTNSSFTTSFDLTSSSNDVFKMQSSGGVTKDGLISGVGQYVQGSNMTVQGALGAEGATAAYLFQSRLDTHRLATGATSWVK